MSVRTDRTAHLASRASVAAALTLALLGGGAAWSQGEAGTPQKKAGPDKSGDGKPSPVFC